MSESDVPPPPKLPDVDSPPPEDVIDETAVPTDDVIDGAKRADEIVDEQPSVDDILGRDS